MCLAHILLFKTPLNQIEYLVKLRRFYGFILPCSHLWAWGLRLVMKMSSVILGMPHRNQGSSACPQPTKTCAGLWLSIHPSALLHAIHPSIHPSGRGRSKPGQQTPTAIALNRSQRAPLPNLSVLPVRAWSGTTSIPVGNKVKRAGAVPSVSIMGQWCNNAVMFLW